MRNFAFPGYAKHVWTRSAFRATHPLRRSQKGFHRLATGGYGPSEDPNRRLPSRCKAPVAARTLTFRRDRWRERSLKHQRCRPKECASVNRKAVCCSSKLHASHSQTRTHHRSRCLNRAWITEGMQPANAGPKE